MFNRTKIHKDEPWKKAERWVKGHILISILAIALGALTLKGVVGAIQVGSPFSVKQIVISAISQDIKTDSHGNTNILLIGVGGEGHDGANLTDTMIVASIDHKEKLLPMLSVPRDFFVDNEEVGYGTRLNSIYELMLEKTDDPKYAMEVLKKEIESLLGIEIQYYAKVDFNGFVDIVDAVGGVNVTVDDAFYDPYYPAPDGSNHDFEPFYLASGEQTLDGEKALKYVRSRKTTSDFDRAKRQQEVIGAIKDKAVSLGLLLNPGKIKSLYSAVSNNFETNLNWSELLHLAGLADQFGKESIISEVLSDQANATGGFLFTPERELYGGAFVLIPYSGDNSEIKTFAHLLLFNPTMFTADTPIQVLNGTKEGGLAAMVKMHLIRYGFDVVRFGNATDQEVSETRIFSNRNLDKAGEVAIQMLSELIPSKILGDTPEEYTLENFETDASVIIELGDDFLDYYNKNNNRFYVGFY